MVASQQTKRSAGYRRTTDIPGFFESEMPRALSPALKKAMKEAEEKRAFHHSCPEQLKETLKKLQQGPPLFGGIGADEFKRRCRDEWN